MADSDQGGFPRCRHARKGKKKGGSRLNLVCSEPFRIFFPTGLALSVAGVSLWPLFYMGWIKFPPMVPHARLMIEGFAGAFIIGFMGTALPRMLRCPRLTLQELILLYVLTLGVAVSHLTACVMWGDWFFLALLVCFTGSMGARFCFLRQQLPPPGFVLAGTGIACAMAGVVMLLVENVVSGSLANYRLAKLLLYQGFVLLPILGVGAFLFRRFIGMEERLVDEAESLKAPPGWRTRAWTALGCGVLVIGTFFLEAAGEVLVARIARGGVVAIYLLREIPLFRRTGRGGTAAFSLRFAVMMIFIGVGGTAFFPLQQKGWDHLMYVSGVGLLILTVASRVILGHSGNIDLAVSKSRPLRWIVWLVFIGATTRTSADFLPRIAVSHHIYAAILWVISAFIWATWLFPKLRDSDDE